MTDDEVRAWAASQGYTFDWQDDWDLGGTHAQYYGLGSAYAPADVPDDYPVRPLEQDDEEATDLATCGECGRSWDDAIPTGLTPVPSGRCPFEAFHGGDPDTCEQCTMRDAEGGIVGSVGCIDDADDAYRAEIEADLAREVYPAWLKGERKARSTRRARRRSLKRAL